MKFVLAYIESLGVIFFSGFAIVAAIKGAWVVAIISAILIPIPLCFLIDILRGDD